MNRYKVTIILATYNRAAILPLCLESIVAQTYQKWKLIIIDDGSTDRTEEVVRPYLDDNRVCYLRNPRNQGMIRSRNRGINQCETDLAFIAEDDVILYQDCLKALVERYNNLRAKGIKNIFCVAPKILNVSSPSQSIGSFQNEQSRFTLNKFTGWIYTHYGNEFVETPILPSVGLYNGGLLRKIKHDENYGRVVFHSDDDLHLTARRLGLRLFYEPKAKARHLQYRGGGCRGTGFFAFARKTYYLWKNHTRFTCKFFGKECIYMNAIFTLTHLIYSCFSLPVAIYIPREGTQESTSIRSFRDAYRKIFKTLSPIILKDLT